MLKQMMEALKENANDKDTLVTVITGTDPYYSAGVNLAGTIRLMHPKKLLEFIRKSNQSVFDTFLDHPKPIIAAINGPAIGASVTSATLCDAIIASEKAIFSTPFARLGIPPEGCSSVHFERIMGKANANRMLFEEGWVPTGQEAKDAGFVLEVFKHEEFMQGVQRIAESWIQSGRVDRWYQKEGLLEEYKKINAKESYALAEAFLSHKFLQAQYEFAKKKGKSDVARTFWIIKTTRPIWSKFL